MKTYKIIMTTLLLLFGLKIGQAKDLTVSEFYEITEDLTARTSHVLDLADNACALIKVTLPDKAAFEGNIVKNEYKTNEYYIYVSPGTQRLVIKYPGTETLTVNFSNFLNSDENKGLKGATTYRLKLEGVPEETLQLVEISSPNLDYQNSGTFTLKVEPSNAEVLINGLPQYLTSSGRLQLNLPLGSHSYRISANKYHSAEGQFKLDKKHKQEDRTVNLKPKFGFLTIDVPSELEGADVVVDGSSYGKLPLTNHPIDNGVHSITISKELYLPFTQNINVIEGKTVNLKPILQPNYAEYQIIVNNDNQASIYIDNKIVGNGFWKGKLEAGSHVIEARKQNHKTETKTVNVIKNTPDKIEFSSLIPEYGTINISTNPKDAVIVIDKERKSSKNIQLKAGKHHVMIYKPDYSTEEFDITIYPNQILNINKKLSKKSPYSYYQWVFSHQNKSFWTIYAAYENLTNSDLTWDGANYKISQNNSGVALGISYDLFTKGFVIAPAFEIAYDANRTINHHQSNAYYIRDSYTEEDYYNETWNWLNIRLPLQVGYRFIFNPSFSLQIQTGPVFDSYIGARMGGDDLECSKPDQSWDLVNNYYEDDEIYIDENKYRYLTYNRFNIDWRLGLSLNFKRFLIGVTYNKGLTDRVGGYTSEFGNKVDSGYYENDIKNTAKQTRNYFQIKIGYIL